MSARTRTAGGVTATRPTARRLWVVLALALVAATAGAVWSLRASSAGPVVAVGEPVTVPGGQVRVDEVSAAGVDPAHASHGTTAAGTSGGASNDNDPPAAGTHRLRIALTGVAGDRGMAWTAGRYAVLTRDGRRVPPHRVEDGDGRLPARTTAHAVLLVDVPEGADRLRLALPGGATVDLGPHTPSSLGAALGAAPTRPEARP